MTDMADLPEAQALDERRFGELLLRAAQSLTSQLDLDALLQELTDLSTELCSAEFGAFFYSATRDDGERYLRYTVSGARRDAFAGFPSPRTTPLLAPTFRGEGVVRVDDVTADARYGQNPPYHGMPPGHVAVRSYLAVPVRSRATGPLGGLFFGHTEPGRFTPEHERLVTALAGYAGIAIDNARLYEAAQAELVWRRKTEQAQALLLEVSTILAATLDYEKGFERLARAAVPVLGDLCLIDVFEAGRIRRVAARHADPDKQALADELGRKYPPELAGRHPATDVILRGASHMTEEMTDEFLRETTRDEEHYDIVKRLGFTSFVSVPLRARGRTLGALTLVSAGSGRRFDAAHLALAENVAQRAALALDNARLFAESSRIARALQASLLPPSLPDLRWAELAARYVPLGEGNDVGGDFYDVFEVGGGSWAVAIGDVCGTGAEAAAVTGLVRHTFRALAARERSPAAMIEQINAALLAEDADETRFCTLCCAVLTPTAAGATVIGASAGHPLPIVRAADGSVRTVLRPGTLLGVFDDVTATDELVVLGAGDELLLYTDGVIEAPARQGRARFGEERLLAAVASDAGAGPDGLLETVLKAVGDFSASQPSDDMALLAVRIGASRRQ
jgi:serine phosphatase RsbU (regulator of sigma subunit)